MRDRRYLAAEPQAVADRDRIGVAGQRDHVVAAENAPLIDDGLTDFRQHYAVALGVEPVVAAGILHRLEGDAAHAGPALRDAQHIADLVIVDAFADDADQRRRDAGCFQRIERPLPDPPQIGAADRLQRLAAQRVELQIHLESTLHLGERGDELRILRDADPVCVQHHMPDRPGACSADDVKDPRVQRRLAAGDLQQVRLAFALDQQIEHALDLGERALTRTQRRRAGETGRAGQIAVLVDLDQRQAAVLLVIRTEAAIIGTALVDAGVKLERHIARLQEIAAALPIRRIGRYQGLLYAVLMAALQVIDAILFLQDLGRHQFEAGLAQRGCLAEKDVRARFARRRLGQASRSISYGLDFAKVLHVRGASRRAKRRA